MNTSYIINFLIGNGFHRKITGLIKNYLMSEYFNFEIPYFMRGKQSAPINMKFIIKKEFRKLYDSLRRFSFIASKIAIKLL